MFVARLAWILALAVLGLVIGCGSDGTDRPGGSKAIEVPVGLKVRCQSAFDGGALSGDGAWQMATMAKDDCLIYHFDTEASAGYSVQALVDSEGQIDLTIASSPDFTELVGGSHSFYTSEPAASSLVAKGGRYYVALSGQADRSSVETRVLRSIARPAGISDCEAVVDGGRLSTDGTLLDDVVLPRSCVMYSFEATANTVYELVFEVAADGAFDRIAIANDREFRDVIARPSKAREYPIMRQAGTHYLIVQGAFATEAHYQVSLRAGSAPIGLANLCFHAEQRGDITKDWSPMTSDLAERECHLYTGAAAVGALYVTALEPVAAQVTELRIAYDPVFQDLVTTNEATVRGLDGAGFIAAEHRPFYVAIMTRGETTASYTLRELETLPPPTGLDYLCDRAVERGSLSVDGAPHSGTLEAGQCALHTLDVVAGQALTLIATPSSGRIQLFAANDANHTNALDSSQTVRDAQSVSFVPSLTGTVHIAVSATQDSAYMLEIEKPVSAPSTLSGDCDQVLRRGELAVAGAPLADFVPDASCAVYTVSLQAGVSYTVRAIGADSDVDKPRLILANNANFSPLLGKQNTEQGGRLVFTPAQSGRHHLAVVAFQGAAYALDVVNSPPPPAALAGVCSSVLDAGNLTVGASSVSAVAVGGQCLMYRWSPGGTAAHTITMYSLGGEPSMTLAKDAAFANIVTTQSRVGGETYSFTPQAAQQYYLAIFPADANATRFQVSIASP
jgi:hypothetical protein